MTEPERVQFRPRRMTWVSVVCAIALVVAFTAVGSLLQIGDTGVAFAFADQVAMVVIGVLLAIGSLLWARPRVRADAEHIEVRNVVTTRRFSWDEVEQVSFPDGAPWARLEMPGDEYESVMAIQAVDRRRAVDAVRVLRSLHRQALQRAESARAEERADAAERGGVTEVDTEEA
ncbi:PH (Pleckstrin Homology) domain-containing protein [Tamaricihabitans halophyticus]|uniref:PH (Pleckstrin Homology) domain-containing protein n=1 Tax=Tamaricihabitans halophyticus TaxID=1262583 RepID=A0A4R2QCX3_9PSEU|nr:PH (Pleckstrin Homology) domain-containing protein [Tamaricihabitans halophyticus]